MQGPGSHLTLCGGQGPLASDANGTVEEVKRGVSADRSCSQKDSGTPPPLFF